jgi:hypothetical protein
MNVTLIGTLRTSPSLYETHSVKMDLLKINVNNHVIRASTVSEYTVCVIQQWQDTEQWVINELKIMGRRY